MSFFCLGSDSDNKFDNVSYVKGKRKFEIMRQGSLNKGEKKEFVHELEQGFYTVRIMNCQKSRFSGFVKVFPKHRSACNTVSSAYPNNNNNGNCTNYQNTNPLIVAEYEIDSANANRDSPHEPSTTSYIRIEEEMDYKNIIAQNYQEHIPENKSQKPEMALDFFIHKDQGPAVLIIRMSYHGGLLSTKASWRYEVIKHSKESHPLEDRKTSLVKAVMKLKFQDEITVRPVDSNTNFEELKAELEQVFKTSLVMQYYDAENDWIRLNSQKCLDIWLSEFNTGNLKSNRIYLLTTSQAQIPGIQSSFAERSNSLNTDSPTKNAPADNSSPRNMLLHRVNTSSSHNSSTNNSPMLSGHSDSSSSIPVIPLSINTNHRRDNFSDLSNGIISPTSQSITNGHASFNSGYGSDSNTHHARTRSAANLALLRASARKLPEDREIRWRAGDVLGQGASGKVFMGFDLDTGKLLAVKEIDLQGRDDTAAEIESLEREIQLMKGLQHENIVQYIWATRTPKTGKAAFLHIFLEYVPGGSIEHLLKKFGRFDESVVRLYTQQVLTGLNYLHQNKILHRDIKGANILVDDRGTCKLADFGASKMIQEQGSQNRTITGTPFYMSPEVIKESRYSQASDIWSVGCTVYEMVTGKPPWYELNPISAMYKIASCTEPPRFPDDVIISPEGRDFLSRCFNLNPEDRPSAEELLAHSFVTTEAVYYDEDNSSEEESPNNYPFSPATTNPNAYSSPRLQQAECCDAQYYSDEDSTISDISDTGTGMPSVAFNSTSVSSSIPIPNVSELNLSKLSPRSKINEKVKLARERSKIRSRGYNWDDTRDDDEDDDIDDMDEMLKQRGVNLRKRSTTLDAWLNNISHQPNVHVGSLGTDLSARLNNSSNNGTVSTPRTMKDRRGQNNKAINMRSMRFVDQSKILDFLRSTEKTRQALLKFEKLGSPGRQTTTTNASVDLFGQAHDTGE